MFTVLPLLTGGIEVSKVLEGDELPDWISRELIHCLAVADMDNSGLNNRLRLMMRLIRRLLVLLHGYLLLLSVDLMNLGPRSLKMVHLLVIC